MTLGLKFPCARPAPGGAFPPRAGKRVIHSGMEAGSRAPWVWPYFHVGSTLLFPWPIFSLYQPRSAQGSLRSEEYTARDLFGYRLHLGCSGSTLPLPLGGNECPPAEGVMAPSVPVLSLARPAVPLTLICCCISAQHELMGVNLGWSVLPVATQVAWKMLSLSQQ